MKMSPFVIVGAQRSGTTLMRLILGCHSGIECHDEPVAHALLRRGDSFERATKLIGLKVPQLTEQLCEPTLSDDETLGLGLQPLAPNTLKRQPVLFMVRSAFDVVASMLSLEGWLDAHGARVLWANARQPAFKELYAQELEEIQHDRCRAATAALIWRYKTEALFRYVAEGMNVLPVRYEALVTSPEATLRRVCGFLRVPWEAKLLRHSDCDHSELINGLAIGFTDPLRPIDDLSVGRGSRQLSETEKCSVHRVTSRTECQLEKLRSTA